MATNIDYDKGYKFFPWQKAVYDCKVPNRVVRVGRQAGKTCLGVRESIDSGLETKKHSLVVCTDYGTLHSVHRECFDRVLAPLIEAGACSPFHGQHSEYTFDRELGGAKIMLRSANKPDTLRGLGGGTVGFIWLDEWAFASQQEYLFRDVLGPFGLAKDVRYLVTSTPHGHEHFYDLCERGRNPDIKNWIEFHFRSTDSPLITPERLLRLIESHKWTQNEIAENIYAEFTDWTSGVFGDFRARAEEYEYPIPADTGHTYIVGADLAEVEDFFVMYVLDVTSKPAQVVYKLRRNKTEYGTVEDLIVSTAKRYNNALAYVDTTNERSFGGRLGRRCRVKPTAFSSKSKPEMVKNLILAFERGDFIYSAKDEDLNNELSCYRAQRTETGYTKYAASRGHDDCVSALMLVVWGARTYIRPGRELAIPFQVEASNPFADEKKGIAAVERFYQGQFGAANFSGDASRYVDRLPEAKYAEAEKLRRRLEKNV